MARSKSEAEFDSLMVQNKDTFLKNRGATSPFVTIDAPPGNYYARIIKAPRDVIEVERKTSDGKGTGIKDKVPRARFQVTLVCANDPQCPAEELEAYAGRSGFIDYRLPKNDNEAMARYYGDLAQIGIDTHNLVLAEADIVHPDRQFTLAQVCELIEEEKPFCRLAITEGKLGGKYLNYRGPVEQADLEGILGHALDNFSGDVEEEEAQEGEEEQYQEVPDVEEETKGQEEEGTEDDDVQWVEEYTAWHRLSDDTWYNKDGEAIESPVKPKTPSKPPIAKKPVPSKPAPKPASSTKKSPPGKPGARPGR